MVSFVVQPDQLQSISVVQEALTFEVEVASPSSTFRDWRKQTSSSSSFRLTLELINPYRPTNDIGSPTL